MARTARTLLRHGHRHRRRRLAGRHPGRRRGKSFDMYDVDANGWYDRYAADRSGKGYFDENVVLVNGAQLWLYDRDEDSRPDAYGTDGTGDGWADLWGYDANEDYVVDSWAYDAAVHPADHVRGEHDRHPHQHGALRVSTPG